MTRILMTVLLLCSALYSSYGQKSDSKQLHDKNARSAPGWIKNGVIYQIQPRAFTREGTLKAATKRLKNVADLGASIVYLCPVFVMDTDTNHNTWSPRQIGSGMENPRNPYRIMDYFHVDPEFGTDEDLKKFIDEAHRLGLKVMLDMVYLHTGANAVFIKKHPDYVKHDKTGKQITSQWHWPELNFDNPSLQEYLYSNMAYWVSVFHIDGFRCDVADGVPLDFWESARARLEVLDPDIAMLSEGQRPEDQLKAFDVNYGFTWFRTLSSVFDEDASASVLRSTWERMTSTRPKGTRFIRFIDTHDISNDSWYDRIEERWGFNGVNASLVLNFTINGIPFIYNGQEIADKARNSIFGNLPVDWSNGNTKEGKERFSFLQELIKIYKKEKALTNGAVRWVDNNNPDAVVSFERDYEGERIVVIINLKNQEANVKLRSENGFTHSSFKPILADKGVRGNIREGFKIDAYGYWIGEAKD